MAQIKNMDGLSADDINRELAEGGQFVVFQYAISIIVVTFRRSSDIYFLRAGESGLKYGWPYILLTALLGWWGIPWGPIYSIGAIYHNFNGGKKVTSDVIAHFNRQEARQYEK